MPSGRVAGGNIPFDIADTGQGAEARALGSVAKGIGDIAGAFSESAEIRSRQDKATNLTQSGLDQQAQVAVQQQIDLAEQDVSINDRTEDFYKDQYESRFKFDESKYGTKQGAKLAKIDFDFRRDSFISEKLIDNGEIAVKNAVQLTEQNYVLAPTEENRVKYAEALSLQDTDAGVKAKLGKADAAARETLKDRSIRTASSAAFSTWQETVTKEDPDGDLNAAFKVIQDSDIPSEDKQEAESELKTRVTNRRAENKLQLEQANAKSSEEVYKKIGIGEYEGINAFIQSQPNLTEAQKVAFQEKAAASAKAVNDNKPDPLQETDSQVYFDTVRNIEDMTEAKLAALTGKGLSIGDYEKLVPMLEKDSVSKTPSVVRGHSAIDRTRSVAVSVAKKAEADDDDVLTAGTVEADYLRISNDYDRWVEENKDKPDFEVKNQKKLEQLLSPVNDEITLGLFDRTTRRKKGVGSAAASAFIFGPLSLLRDTEEERKEEIRRGQITEPTTQAEFDAIPSGSEFKDTDGVIKVKK